MTRDYMEGCRDQTEFEKAVMENKVGSLSWDACKRCKNHNPRVSMPPCSMMLDDVTTINDGLTIRCRDFERKT